MNMQLPNVLSIIRLALGAVFAVLLLAGNTAASAIVFLVAMATDVLDGYLARKLGQQSQTGIVLDAIADKLVLTLAFLLLVYVGKVSALIGGIAIAYHLLTIIGLGVVYSKIGRVIEHAWSGKLVAFVQTILVPFAIMDWHQSFLGDVLVWSMLIAILLSVIVYNYLGAKAMMRK